MSSARGIHNKIICAKNTQKITKAMEMVAASKMRKSLERMIASRPYEEIMRKVINHITLGNLEYKHSYLEARDIQRVGYLVVSTDRGLCGGLNSNLFKKIITDIKNWSDKSIESNLAIIGSKGLSFFSSFGFKILAQLTDIGETVSISELIGPVKVMLDAYDACYIDKVFIVSNKFINTVYYTPKIFQLLPLVPIEDTKDLIKKSNWDYLYESDPKILLDMLLQRYIESQVYQAVVENIASEQAARMVSMKAATDNGGSLIKELELIYNKARQASITQEITEIMSGASAV